MPSDRPSPIRGAGQLAHAPVARVSCASPSADDPLLWEWLVDELDVAHFRVARTELSEDGLTRWTELLFASELDVVRFLRWARMRRFDLGEFDPDDD